MSLNLSARQTAVGSERHSDGSISPTLSLSTIGHQGQLVGSYTGRHGDR